MLDAGELFGGADHVRGHGDEDVVGAAVEGFVETGGEDAGLEAIGTEDGVLGHGGAREGQHFLGVDGLVDGDEIGFELVDVVEAPKNV